MMTKYPVFRSLYKPLFMGGVPLLFLFGEIIAAAILIILRLYILLLVVAAVHFFASKSFKKDPYFFAIMMDVSGLSGTNGQRRKADETLEAERESQAEDSED